MYDNFENRPLAWQRAFLRLSVKVRNVDPVIRSRRVSEKTKYVIQEVFNEAEELESSHRDIEAQSRSIVKCYVH